MDTLNRNFFSKTAVTLILVFCFLAPVAWSEDATDAGKRAVDIATVNLYVGSDFSHVLALDPTDPAYGLKFLNGVTTIFSNIQQSNFPVRAEALARQIVTRGPDVVALQEVSLLRRQPNGDAAGGGTTPAEDVVIDYLQTLLDALHRNGGHYAVVSQVQNVDIEAPMLTPTGFVDIRLTDRDVIIARTDLPPGHLRVYNAMSGNYSFAVPLPLPGPTPVFAFRGWCSIDVESRGRNLRVINTHLEDRLPPGAPNVQLGQAAELLGEDGPAYTTLPVILTGDFNSDALNNYSPETYGLFTQVAGFTDLWSQVGGQSAGLTWGHDELLSDFSTPFTLRLDLILFRGPGLVGDEVGVVDPVIGTAPPYWFSDHGGVFGKIRIE